MQKYTQRGGIDFDGKRGCSKPLKFKLLEILVVNREFTDPRNREIIFFRNWLFV